MPGLIKLKPPNRKAGSLKTGTERAELSATDSALIRRLQQDGRETFADLARHLDVAEPTVRRRVAELREAGIIEITTVVAPQLLGYFHMALVGVKLGDTARASDVARDLIALASVDYVVVTTGRYDLMVEILARDEPELLAIMETALRGHGGISAIEVFPYLDFRFQQPIWDAAQVKNDVVLNPSVLPRLDATDMALLEELNRDGRVAFSHVAARLEVSEGQIRKRYARLLESQAVRVMALTNPLNLGFRTTAWLGINVAAGVSAAGFADRLVKLRSIAYLVVCAGRFDIFAEVVCANTVDLLRLLDDDIRPMVEVSRVEPILSLQLHYTPISV